MSHELHEACLESDVERVQALLARLVDTDDAGAELEARDPEGNTPLLLAAKGESPEAKACVSALLRAGADVGATNNQGDTALMFNACWGHAAMLELLLEHGADVNARDNLGKSALLWAAEHGHIRALEVLIAHGADVHASVGGRTPLMHAAAHGSNAAVERLLRAGARVDTVDQSGETALSLARRYAGRDLEAALGEEFAQEPWVPAGARIEVERTENEAGETVIEVRYRLDEEGRGAGYLPRCDAFAAVVATLTAAGAR